MYSSMNRTGSVVLGFLLFLVSISIITMMVVGLHFWLFLRVPAKTVFESRQFFIPPKTSAFGVASLLQSQGVIRDARAFYVLCWLKKSLNRLQAGEYAFWTSATPEQILDQIVNGRVVIHSVTLPEGSTIWDLARILEQKELAASGEILQLVNSPELLKALGIKGRTLEGYLFPDTYHFKKPVSGTQILKAMAGQFWLHLPNNWQARAASLGHSLNEIVTMASMVEKEAVVDPERPIIAGVFYNRLKINMPLQSDPTAVYDLPGFSGPVTAAHLTRVSPYNTYQIKGLPPGPICNPGVRSLMAAFNPEKVPYYYFVSNNDGTHSFSVTVEEHKKAVSRYYDLKRNAAAEKKPVPEKAVEATGAGEQNIQIDPGKATRDMEGNK